MFSDLGSQAYTALRYNRRRSLLTMLGMAWGIATVVLLLAYGAGFQHAIEAIYDVAAGDNLGWSVREGSFVFKRTDRCHVYPLPADDAKSGYISPVAAYENSARGLYGIQFHPEVVHTPYGQQILTTFLEDICGCARDWNMPDYAAEAIARIPSAIAYVPNDTTTASNNGMRHSAIAAPNSIARTPRPAIIHQFFTSGCSSAAACQPAAARCWATGIAPCAAVTSVKVNDGQFENYMAWLQGNWKKVMEESKKAGYVLDYHVYSAQAHNPNEADLYLVVTYPNMAMLDAVAPKLKTGVKMLSETVRSAASDVAMAAPRRARKIVDRKRATRQPPGPGLSR